MQYFFGKGSSIIVDIKLVVQSVLQGGGGSKAVYYFDLHKNVDFPQSHPCHFQPKQEDELYPLSPLKGDVTALSLYQIIR